MLLQPYSVDQLNVAWCNRIFVRCRTHRRKAIERLASLTPDILHELLQPYGIHLLELVTTTTELQLMLSLKSNESTSAATTKGRVSKWLSDQVPSNDIDRKLARGYFAVTLGDPDSQSVHEYLESQSEHHGYHDRVRPPVFVQSFDNESQRKEELATDHAMTLLRYHVVLATWGRRGVFIEDSARCVTERWRELQQGYLIDKVSFVPDHVHVAISLHPAQGPVDVVAKLMNSAQELMWDRFPNLVIKSSLERLWEPGAYVGSFGELSGRAIKAYMQRWASEVG